MQMIPAARSRPKVSGARAAIRMPAYRSVAKMSSVRMAPISPSSSPMIAKMKSLCALGR